MRLAVVVPQFAYPKTGGVGPHAKNLAEAFSARGDEVLIVSDGSLSGTSEFEVKSVGTTWSLQAAFRGFAALRAFAPDAVLFEYTTFNFGGKSVAPVVLAAALRATGFRVAAYIHEIFYQAGSAAVRSPLKARIFRLRDALFVRIPHCLFVANDAKRRRLLALAPFLRPQNVHIVPIGANIEPLPDEAWSSGDSHTVVSFGVVMPRRRYEILIDAVAHLIKAGHELRLLLIGNIFDSAYAKRCCELAAKHGIEHRMVLTGALEEADVTQALRTSAVFGYALEDGLISSSGTLLAAFAHGIPVIATASAADEDDLAACTVRCEASAVALSEAIARTIGAPETCRALSDAGRKLYRERFSWHAIAATIADKLA
jgi:glycosyltransferase involved in cell wall biosynthesis